MNWLLTEDSQDWLKIRIISQFCVVVHITAIIVSDLLTGVPEVLS